MIRRRYEVMAECVHFRHRADLPRVAEIVGEFPACEARTACRFNSDKLIVSLAPQFFAHERRNQSAQIRAASSTADDDVGFDAVLLTRFLCLKSDY